MLLVLFSLMCAALPVQVGCRFFHITTPDGETLSIVMLEDDRNHEGIRMGVSAPHDYRILRHGLRNQLLKRLRDIPIFEVCSALHETHFIVADDYTAATHFYQQLYPTSCAIVAMLPSSPGFQGWKRSGCRTIPCRWVLWWDSARQSFPVKAAAPRSCFALSRRCYWPVLRADLPP